MNRFRTTANRLCIGLILCLLAGCGPDYDDINLPDCFPFACSPTTAAPSVSTEAATGITATSAVLNGYVNPNWKDTGAWFEWGTDANLADGIRTPSQFLGSGDRTIPFNAVLDGLSSGSTYYYRAAAYNVIDGSYGKILHFSTP